MSTSKDDPVTDFMHPSPIPNPNETRAPGADLVIVPLSDGKLVAHVESSASSHGKSDALVSLHLSYHSTV